MFGRRVLLFRKRRAVISEALGAYFGSAGRLFWKRTEFGDDPNRLPGHPALSYSYQFCLK